jgi:hypothetical protein
MKKRYSSKLFLFFIICIATSCRYSVKTIGSNGELKELRVNAKEAKQIIAKAKENQQRENAKIDSINIEKEKKIDEQNIDTSIGHKIDQRIAIFKRKLDSVAKEISSVENAFASKNSFRKVFRQVKYQLLFIDEYNKEASTRMLTLQMFTDGLSLSTQKMFELAAFFGTGGYKVPDEKLPSVEALFKPLVDSLIWFANKYKEVPRTAYITVLGYADGEGVIATSNLAQVLTGDSTRPNPSKEELNLLLSQKRADGLSDIFLSLIAARKAELISSDKLTNAVVSQGRGEEYPNPKIKDYQVSDARRRIVLCFWSVLPD